MTRTLMLLVAAGLLLPGTAGAARLDGARNQPLATMPMHVQYDRPADRAALIDDREARINRRIQRGLSDGSITHWEARRLYRELGHVRQKERAFRADGRIGQREFAELIQDLDRLAVHVREQRWDDQRRDSPRQQGYYH